MTKPALHPDYGNIKVAVNRVHYVLERGLYITTLGLEVLTKYQRDQLHTAFYFHTLGDEFEFKEVLEYAPEELAEEKAADAEEKPDDEVMAEASEGAIERLADKIYEDRRDRRWLGCDYDRNRKGSL